LKRYFFANFLFYSRLYCSSSLLFQRVKRTLYFALSYNFLMSFFIWTGISNSSNTFQITTISNALSKFNECLQRMPYTLASWTLPIAQWCGGSLNNLYSYGLVPLVPFLVSCWFMTKFFQGLLIWESWWSCLRVIPISTFMEKDHPFLGS